MARAAAAPSRSYALAISDPSARIAVRPMKRHVVTASGKTLASESPNTMTNALDPSQNHRNTRRNRRPIVRLHQPGARPVEAAAASCIHSREQPQGGAPHCKEMSAAGLTIPDRTSGCRLLPFDQCLPRAWRRNDEHYL